MKRCSYLLLFLLLCVECSAQKDKQCDVKLLSQHSVTEKCGIVKASEMLKFVVQKSKASTDTVIFYVLCPADYADDFWGANHTYHIHYQRSLSAIKSSIIVDRLSKKDKTYKVLGVIKDASRK